MHYTFILNCLCLSAFTLAEEAGKGDLRGRQNNDAMTLDPDASTLGTSMSQSTSAAPSTGTSIITTSSSLSSSFTGAPVPTASSAVTSTWATLMTTSAPYWGVTTTYTQPMPCVGGISQYPNTTYGFWQNIVEPVSGFTLTSCYPEAFLASATATVDLPPFEQLICPYQWETYDFNETYIICCPSAYGLFAPGWASNSQRPGLDAVCTSGVGPGIYIDVTNYLYDGLVLVTGTTVTSYGPLPIVQATAFDGIRATAAVLSATQVAGSGSASETSTAASVGYHTGASVSSSSTEDASTSSHPSSASENSGTKVTASSSLAEATTPTMSTPQQSANTLESGATSESVQSSRPASPASTSRLPITVSDTLELTTTTMQWAGPTAISQLPSCGQTCFHNMLGQYLQLGCTTDDPACLCHVANFGYGIRDCSNGACGASVGSSVISFASSYYCPSAIAARTTFPATAAATPTAISQLPACGQLCFHNMLAQHSDLGCSSPDAACLCGKINFFYGIRDCSNGACGAVVASTVISFESRWCASATAAV